MVQKPVRVSKDFYSNCVIVTFLRKLTHWKTTKVIYIPRKYNGGRTPHVMWQDLNSGRLFEFSTVNPSPSFLESFFEKGYIQETPKERHELIMQKNFEFFMNKMQKKYGFTTKESEYQAYYIKNDWHDVDFYGMPRDSDLNDVKMFLGKTKKGKVKLFNMKDLDNMDKSSLQEWKPV